MSSAGLLAVPIFIITISLIVFIGISYYTEYRPNSIEKLDVHKQLKARSLKLKDEYSILSWNVGYFGLGKEADFFAAGGKGSKPATRDIMEKHMHGILETIKRIDPDFLFLQEMDISSARTYFFDQYGYAHDYLRAYNSSFAYNYKVFFVPVPVKHSMGRIRSGLATFSKCDIKNSNRYSLPGMYSYPIRLFHLKRCVIVSKIDLDGNELYVLNVHASAFDKNGVIRKEQLKFIKQLALDIYTNKSKYVIIGGDWNSEMLDINLSSYKMKEKRPDWSFKLPKDFCIDGWNWDYVKNIPTCRSTKTKYIEGENFLTIIDGFLTSPEIEIASVSTYDYKFLHSDHNPVLLKFNILK